MMPLIRTARSSLGPTLTMASDLFAYTHSLILSCFYNFVAFPIIFMRKMRSNGSRNKACKDLLIFLLQFFALYWIFGIVHTDTYVLQSTALAGLLRPVKRTKCELNIHSLADFDSKKVIHMDFSHSDIPKLHDGKNSPVLPGVKNSASISFDATNSTRYLTGIESSTSSSGSGTREKKIRHLTIGLIYLYDSSPSGGNGNDGGQSWSGRLMDHVLDNREEYCRRHGYSLVNANHLVDKTRPAAWSKLRAMDYYLSLTRGGDSSVHRNILNKKNSTRDMSSKRDWQREKKNNNDSTHELNTDVPTSVYMYDYLLYMDMDVIIMNLDKKLEEFIHFADREYKIRKIASGNKMLNVRPEFLMTEDWKGPNTGTWFVRNTAATFSSHQSSSFSSSLSSTSSSSSSTDLIPAFPTTTPNLLSHNFPFWFLRTAWSQVQLIKKYSTEGIPHPFEYEQRAFHSLLGTTVWKDRGLDRFQGDLSVEDIRSHFTFFPQCSFNSYSLHPLDFRGDREVSQYVDGDFVIHFAGKKGRKKLLLMKHYLQIAQKSYK